MEQSILILRSLTQWKIKWNFPKIDNPGVLDKLIKNFRSQSDILLKNENGNILLGKKEYYCNCKVYWHYIIVMYDFVQFFYG